MAPEPSKEEESAGNWRLHDARSRRGWSRRATANALRVLAVSLGEPEPPVDSRQIRWWEQGRHTPRAYYTRLLVLLFQAEPGELGLPPLPPALLSELHVKRREFVLGSIGTLLGATALPTWSEAWDRLLPALREPRFLDQKALDSYGQTLAILESLEPTLVSPVGLVGAATGHLQSATSALQGSLTDSVRRQLLSLTGETAALCGWLEWNLSDKVTAAHHLRTAVDAAQQAEDRALGAYLTGCAVCWLDVEPRAKITRLRGAAFGFHQEDASPWTRVWLAAKEADAAAALKDEAGTQRALQRAETAAARAELYDGQERPRWHRWDERWLLGEQGASLGRLGSPEAPTMLRKAMGAIHQERAKDRPWLLMATARMHVSEGEPEQACQLADIVLAHTSAIRSAPLVEEVRRLRRDLQPWATSSAVRQLDERLRTIE